MYTRTSSQKLTIAIGIFLIATAVIVGKVWRKSQGPMPLIYTEDSISSAVAPAPMMGKAASGVSFDAAVSRSSIMPPVYGGESVKLGMQNRKVIGQADLSLLVKDVRASVQSISQAATAQGGFVVNSWIGTPEEGGSGSLSVRVPTEKTVEFLNTVRGLAVRVVSENQSGNDITDQFQDVEARLATLQETRTRFQELFSKAKDVDEILRTQQALLDLQNQIDSLKGQQQYLDEASKSTLITISVSTDELSLPYAPNQSWRPQAIFKEAVRALVSHVRGFGELIIWTIVFGVLWIPALIIGWVVYRKLFSRNSQ